jgi:hypothetical protein
MLYIFVAIAQSITNLFDLEANLANLTWPCFGILRGIMRACCTKAELITYLPSLHIYELCNGRCDRLEETRQNGPMLDRKSRKS